MAVVKSFSASNEILLIKINITQLITNLWCDMQAMNIIFLFKLFACFFLLVRHICIDKKNKQKKKEPELTEPNAYMYNTINRHTDTAEPTAAQRAIPHKTVRGRM